MGRPARLEEASKLVLVCGCRERCGSMLNLEVFPPDRSRAGAEGTGLLHIYGSAQIFVLDQESMRLLRAMLRATA